MTLPIRIVTVTYNSAGVIAALLGSVPDGVEVVVVDNASSDDSAAIAERHGATVIRAAQNHGFGSACNLGAEGNERGFVFFVNPDAVLEEGCCAALLAAAERHPEAGAMNPAILEPDGGFAMKRRSCLLDPSDWTPRDLAVAGSSAQVNILHGAALFCRQEAFEQVGGFDDRIFLYHEDDDLSLRLRQAGWTLRLEHEAAVRHIGSGSTGYSKASVRAKARAIAQSRLYVEQKHARPRPYLGAYIRALGKLASPLAWLSGRKRTQAIGYVQGVAGYDAKAYGTR
jgi:GT2 family glycosyltransferase